jgi:hypothetical protein
MDSTEFIFLELVIVLLSLFGQWLLFLTGQQRFTNSSVLGDMCFDQLVHTQVKHVVLDCQVAARRIHFQTLFVVHKDDFDTKQFPEVVL